MPITSLLRASRWRVLSLRKLVVAGCDLRGLCLLRGQGGAAGSTRSCVGAGRLLFLCTLCLQALGVQAGLWS